MPSLSEGWVLHIVRDSVQTRSSDGKKRTVGRYRVLHDGAEQGGDLVGTVAESRGPGANRPEGNGRRFEEGWYPLATHLGPKYRTIGFDPDSPHMGNKKPAIRLRNTDERVGILIHPGVNFLSSIGCFNPCTSLPDATEMIDWNGSRRRTIAIIEDLRTYLGADFPAENNRNLPRSHFFIEREP